MKNHQMEYKKRYGKSKTKGFPKNRPISAAAGMLNTENSYQKRPLSRRATIQHRPTMVNFPKYFF